jgi:hypothetical protein
MEKELSRPDSYARGIILPAPLAPRSLLISDQRLTITSTPKEIAGRLPKVEY